MDAYVMARRLASSINHGDEEEHRACGMADLMKIKICEIIVLLIVQIIAHFFTCFIFL